MIYYIYCKNFGKYHNVPLPGTTIKKTLKEEIEDVPGLVELIL
jgi:hypothetical protein